MNKTLCVVFLLTLLGSLVGCKSEPITNAAPHVAEGAQTTAPADPARPSAATQKPKAADAGAPSAKTDKTDKKEGALPDVEHEKGCVLFHWTTLDPSWDREDVTFDAAARTLSLMGSARHFDEHGLVVDFGEGTDTLAYDKAGNQVSRSAGKTGMRSDYKYKNHYDRKGRLERVDAAMKPLKGTWSAFAPYRQYHYGDDGRVDHMDVQVVPTGPLLPVRVENDAPGHVVQLTWGVVGATKEIERFHYDSAGRLTSYERDGLVIPPGRPVTGKNEWTQTWQYGDDGLPKRLDGREGGDSDKAPHEITLFSPGCTAVGTLWPDLYVFPYVPLPAPGARFLGN